MSDKNFTKKYLEDFSSLLKPNEELVEKIISVKDILINAKKNNAKIMIFGNGGSAAIASHMAIDYSKNGRLPALAMNDGAALTCLGNDLFAGGPCLRSGSVW